MRPYEQNPKQIPGETQNRAVFTPISIREGYTKNVPAG